MLVGLRDDFFDPIGFLETVQKAARAEFVKTLNASRSRLFG